MEDIKKILDNKTNPYIYAEVAEDGSLAIGVQGALDETLALVGTFLKSISTRSGVPLPQILATMIAAMAEMGEIEVDREYFESETEGRTN